MWCGIYGPWRTVVVAVWCVWVGCVYVSVAWSCVCGVVYVVCGVVYVVCAVGGVSALWQGMSVVR